MGDEVYVLLDCGLTAQMMVMLVLRNSINVHVIYGACYMRAMQILSGLTLSRLRLHSESQIQISPVYCVLCLKVHKNNAVQLSTYECDYLHLRADCCFESRKRTHLFTECRQFYSNPLRIRIDLDPCTGSAIAPMNVKQAMHAAESNLTTCRDSLLNSLYV